MKGIKLTKVGKITVSLCMLLTLFVGLITVNSIFGNESEEKEYLYVSDLELDNPKLVISTSSSNLLIRPYLNTSVEIIKGFYDSEANEESQVDSIVYYESTYMPNYAVAYGGIEENFEVISVLDGTVVSVREDGLLGSIIEIQHENNVLSVYQSVSNIKVEENQVVKQGDVIALSGQSNLNKELNSHLLFELVINSNIVNPEEYYNKDIN